MVSVRPQGSRFVTHYMVVVSFFSYSVKHEGCGAQVHVKGHRDIAVARRGLL